MMRPIANPVQPVQALDLPDRRLHAAVLLVLSVTLSIDETLRPFCV